MKLEDLQVLDQNIIKALSSHKGIDRAIQGKMLAQSLKIDLRTLQSRIEGLQKKHCAIGSIDGLGYFIPLNEDERRAGIIKKMKSGVTINNAVDGYMLAEISWLDELIGG
ncbi:hypothetical protein GYN67_04885 [Lactococcus piscium]|uniref:hypothetical protein n=1 Tax=Pseudolactococcus carnosus TaxID=2749961 RepID=UPI001FBB1AB8|nr:hypothetical protein [Lactococcus carnosus]MCJ1996014.1 hypothetical protein [Lactococcus carnosus]